MSTDASAAHKHISTSTIYLIRHGEKPADTPPPHGVTAAGDHDEHSLSTSGWQRAGALVTLFAPLDKQFRPGFMSPARLVAPKYTDPKAPAENERTHQTIAPIMQATGQSVETPCKVGDEDTKQHGQTLGETL